MTLTKLRILFEDDISWYVEDLNEMDGHSHYIRRSLKKTSFGLEELPKTFLLFVPELRAKAYEVQADTHSQAKIMLHNYFVTRVFVAECKRRADKDFVLEDGYCKIFGADK